MFPTSRGQVARRRAPRLRRRRSACAGERRPAAHPRPLAHRRRSTRYAAAPSATSRRLPCGLYAMWPTHGPRCFAHRLSARPSRDTPAQRAGRGRRGACLCPVLGHAADACAGDLPRSWPGPSSCPPEGSRSGLGPPLGRGRLRGDRTATAGRPRSASRCSPPQPTRPVLRGALTAEPMPSATSSNSSMPALWLASSGRWCGAP